MRLLTLNCHSWQEEQQDEKIAILAQTIVERDYDVIALQEVSQLAEGEIQPDGLKEKNFGTRLLQELAALGRKDEMVWAFAHIGFEIYEEGVAILTKHPIIGRDTFIVSKANDPLIWKTRAIAHATIDYHGQPIDFFSCHLGWWTDEEEPYTGQIDALVSHLSEDRLAFLLGDFNNHAERQDEGYDYILSKGLHDTYTLASEKDSGITIQGAIAGWSGNKEDLRIDYIFANQPVTVTSSRVIFNDDHKPVVSDHFGVEIDVALEK